MHLDTGELCRLHLGKTSTAFRPVVRDHQKTEGRRTAPEGKMLPLLTQAEAARFLRLSERTLERYRHSGGGPKFVRQGKCVRYRQEDLEAWVAGCTVGSTSEAEKFRR